MNRRGFLARAGAFLAAGAVTCAPLLPAHAETDDERIARLLDAKGAVRDETFHLTRPIVLPDRAGDFHIEHCTLYMPGGFRVADVRHDRWLHVFSCHIDARSAAERALPSYTFKGNAVFHSYPYLT